MWGGLIAVPSPDDAELTLQLEELLEGFSGGSTASIDCLISE